MSRLSTTICIFFFCFLSSQSFGAVGSGVDSAPQLKEPARDIASPPVERPSITVISWQECKLASLMDNLEYQPAPPGDVGNPPPKNTTYLITLEGEHDTGELVFTFVFLNRHSKSLRATTYEALINSTNKNSPIEVEIEFPPQRLDLLIAVIQGTCTQGFFLPDAIFDSIPSTGIRKELRFNLEEFSN